MNNDLTKSWQDNDVKVKDEAYYYNAGDTRNYAGTMEDGDSRYWDGNISSSSIDYERNSLTDGDINQSHTGKRNSADIPNSHKKQRFPASPDAADKDSTFVRYTLTGINVLLFDGNYFELLEFRSSSMSRKMGSIIALCKACPGHVTIKGSLGVSSNFLHHLKQRHPELYLDFTKKKATNCKRNKKVTVVCKTNINTTNDDSEPETKFLNTTDGILQHEPLITYNDGNRSLEFEEKLLNFLIAANLPLKLVKNEQFFKLFEGTPLMLSNVEQLSTLLTTNYDHCMENIKNSLKHSTYCCTTADIFTDGACTFLAYTCHWLDNHTFERWSAALACRRLSKSYKNDEVKNVINEVNETFQLENNQKLVLTIVNNGYDDAHSDLLYLVGVSAATAHDVFMDTDNIQFLTIPHIAQIRKLICLCNSFHKFCATNLISGIERAERSVKQKHLEAFECLRHLWKRLKEATVAGCPEYPFAAPKDISINSIYKSLETLLQEKYQLLALCNKLQVQSFDCHKIAYLQEFLDLISPIVNAIVYLQKPENMYFGYFFATVVSLKVKLKKLIKSRVLTMLQLVCEDLVCALNQEFKEFFELHDSALDAFVAAVTCPSIKLKISNALRETTRQYDLEGMKQIILNYATPFSSTTMDINAVEESKPQISQLQQDLVSDDFLDFDEAQTASNSIDLLRNELEQYLADPNTSFDCLQHYPTIQKVFFKYNTPLPSEMPVKQLLKFSEILNSAARMDRHFEKQLLCKANSRFWQSD